MAKPKRRNICWTCKHWEECYVHRYYYEPQSYMESYWTDYDDDKNPVIYVEKCSKFKFEPPDYPIYKLCQFDFDL